MSGAISSLVMTVTAISDVSIMVGMPERVETPVLITTIVVATITVAVISMACVVVAPIIVRQS